MASSQFGSILQHIRQLIGHGTTDQLTDSELLDRFATRQDEAAFQVLLQRHGPMVLGLCRSVLHDPNDAEDAFQATFLVLARKAASIRKRQSLASWLYGVARRTALRAKVSAAKRRVHERQDRAMPHTDVCGEVGQDELRSVVTEELQRLPEKYRAPLILCYLEGKTNESAARELGWPTGSMSKQLARARDLLRERLAYRGVGLSTAILAAALTETTAQAALPPVLLETTLRASVLYAAGKATAGGVVSAQVLALADGVVRSLATARWQFLAVILLCVGLLGGGASLLTFGKFGGRGAPPESATTLPIDAQETVVLFDMPEAHRAPAKDDEPLLRIRADRTLVLGSPDGLTRRIEATLSAAQVQDLLRLAVSEQRFFDLDADKARSAVRAEEVKRGLAIPSGNPTVIHIHTAGRDHEVRYEALAAQARRFPEVKELQQLLAVQRRLEQLITWLHAGGQEGVDAALRLANEQLRRQFPEAPPLTAQDLQSARQRVDGVSEVVLERRGVSASRDPFSFVYVRIERAEGEDAKVTVRANLGAAPQAASTGKPEEKTFPEPLNVNPPPIATDPGVKYDYDIVYVRAKRAGDQVFKRYYTDIARPVSMEPGADLMLLHPDGSEEVLIEGGAGAVADPMVSFDGEWVYYTHIYQVQANRTPPLGADIYKIHVPTRKVVRLTHQVFTPNTGAADWSADYRKATPGKNSLPYGVLNFGACPLPGGKVAFTSNRNAFRPPRGDPPVVLQLFVMDDDGSNVEQIGHLNLAGALHPVALRDGRIMFSSLESQGIRTNILWGIWTINPDGTHWAPLVSAFDPHTSPNAFHFQTQLSDGSVIVEGYYNQNNSGFGTYIKLPEPPLRGHDGNWNDEPRFASANMHDPRSQPLRFGRYDNGRGWWYRMPFMPLGAESLTPFVRIDDGPAGPSILGDKDSPAVGKFTHPSGAPDNHLLTIWSPGPVNHQYPHAPQIDGGIYLIKSGKPIDEPGQMRLIKNDPNYNEQWPRALVPYRRIYGVDEPCRLPASHNDGQLSRHLPEGTPYGLVGSSSLLKRESFPNGVVPASKVTAGFTGGNDLWKGLDALTSHGNGMPLNWANQGADAGLYTNDDVHAIRILFMEPTTDRRGGAKGGRLFYSHARERLRIRGEIPVRKFRKSPSSLAGEGRGEGGQPLDPDGNPDTSFLAKFQADTAFTFQTLDQRGMVLNMAQTWHQLRPGEMRNDCGGCHAHSQKPTPFERTAAARPDYSVWDLTRQTPLLTAKVNDRSGKQWDVRNATGLRFETGVVDVEYRRHIQPILQRSCVACHSKKSAQPAGNLILDADAEAVAGVEGFKLPGTYARLAADERARFGHKPIGWPTWGYPQASRYVRMFQSRRSLLVWKIYGERLDGFHNDDHPHEPEPGAGTLVWKGKPVDVAQNREKVAIPYVGSIMPPPAAVAGNYVGSDGQKIKVAPLSDEDRRTIVRWIDLGCPVDLDFDPAKPHERGYGWMADDNRPTLTLTYPRDGVNPPLTRLLVGMDDYYSGLDLASFRVVADFPLGDIPAGQNLAPKFKPKGDGVWELALTQPLVNLPRAKLTVSVQDRQGNVSRIERTFSVAAAAK